MTQAWYCALAKRSQLLKEDFWYPSLKPQKRQKGLTHSEAQRICDRRNALLRELELATSDILPPTRRRSSDVAEAGASVAGRGSRS